MKFIFTHLCLMLFFTIGITVRSPAQSVPPSDTTQPPPPPIKYNAGFDVIIKKNGEILYGLVKEVGLLLVKYQRTDIPDGPVYTIPRDEIYAISYRNQVKDILSPVPVPEVNHPYSPNRYRRYGNKQGAFDFRDGGVRIGLGFFRSYTGVTDPGSYAAATTFPVISIAYDAYYRDQVRLGVEVAFGPHKFSKQEYSMYDSTKTDVTLKETIFTLYAYGKYAIANLSSFRPYIIGGLGIRSSYIRSEHDVSFVNDPGKTVVVKSGSRSLGIGVLARIGTDYYVNNKFSVFGDVGIGPSILNIGVSAGID